MTAAHSTKSPPRARPEPSRLAGKNLNLVVMLDALLAEANVTRAAAKVGVTQSAMSHALAELRRMTGDDLLVRGRGGMVRTPRAEELAAPVRRGLASSSARSRARRASIRRRARGGS